MFAQPTVAASNGQAGMPLFLHGQGKQALKALGVAVPSFPITTVDLASAVRPSRDVYGRRAEVMTVGALVDALTAKAETLQNLTIRKDVVVSGLHAQQGQLFVDGVVRFCFCRLWCRLCSANCVFIGMHRHAWLDHCTARNQCPAVCTMPCF